MGKDETADTKAGSPSECVYCPERASLYLSRQDLGLAKKNNRRNNKNQKQQKLRDKRTNQNKGLEEVQDYSPEMVLFVILFERSMVPMTKEEYEKQQAQVRRVYDPDTGRHR